MALIGLLFGCTSKVKEPEKIEENNDGFVVGDLLATYELLGKTKEEMGIPDELIRSYAGWEEAYLDGTLLTTTDYGVIHFKPNDSNILVADSIWIHVGEVKYQDCLKALIERFGEPIDDGQEPYVEVNGGSVRWITFEYESFLIKFSQASERNYCEINIKMK